MSISTETNRADYVGTNSTALYNFSFKIFAKSDLKVIKETSAGVVSTLVLDTDYTVPDGDVNETAGGTITLLAGNLPTGDKLTILRRRPLTQQTDIRNTGDLYKSVLEDAYDHDVMIAQQQQEQIDRGLKMPETVKTSDFDPTLPTTITTAESRVIQTKADGTGVELGATATEVANAETYANNAATSATESATSATASATSATESATSATASAASASAAAASETNAAASATSVALIADSIFWNDIEFLTFADSPYTVTSADRGKLFSIDCTGGAVAIALPEISTLDLTQAFVVGFKKTDSGSNAVTLNRGGSDEIDGGSLKNIVSAGSGTTLIPDTDPTPDAWTSADFGSGAGNVTVDRFSGDASTTVFNLSVAPGTENNTHVYISGVYQQKDDYTLSGTALTFSAAPPTGTDNIEVLSISQLAIGTPADGTITSVKLDASLQAELDNKSDASKVETFTNKTIDDSLTIKEVAEPSSPASGYQALYFDTADNKPKRKTSTGEVLDLGGSGGGGFNLEVDAFAQLSEDGSTGNWLGYDDAAAAPVDLTGGTFDTTFANSAADTTILSGDYAGNFLWTLDAADRQGEGVAKTFTIPPALRGKAIYISGRYTTDVATANGDFGLYAYDVTNTALMNIRGLDGSNNLGGLSAGAIGEFTAVIYTASDTASVRLGFHRKVTDATATEFRFSDLRVTDSATVDAPIVSDWVEFTPTFNNVTEGTGAFKEGKYRRVGNTMEVIAALTFGTGGAVTGGMQINIPSGFNVDHSQLVNIVNTSTGFPFVGHVYAYDQTAVRSYGGSLLVSGKTNALSAYVSDGISATWIASVPFIWAANDQVEFKFALPITEWANSSAVLSTTEMLNETSHYRAARSSQYAIPHNIPTPFNVGENVTVKGGAISYRTGVGYNATLGTWTTDPAFIINEDGTYDFDGAAAFIANTTNVRIAEIYRNGSRIAVTDRMIGTLDVNRITFQLSGIELSKGDEIVYKVFQNSGGALNVGSDGTNYNYMQASKRPDLSVYSVYGETELIEASSAGVIAYPITVSQYGDLASLDLSPGEWEISTHGFYYSAGATTTTIILLGITSTSGNSSAGMVDGDTALSATKRGPSDSRDPMALSINVTLNAPTTYYLKGFAGASTANLQVAYKISARRIK